MVLLPYEEWPAHWPHWGEYLQWLVQQRGWSPQHVKLAVQDKEGMFVSCTKEIDFSLPLHVLAFQPPSLRLYRWGEVPEGINNADIEHWAVEQGGQCRSHFFLGYHPWGGKNEAWEIAGNRWWPTYAWLRGWTWHFGRSE